MSAHIAFLPVVLAAGVALFSWFYRLAKADRRATILTFILGLIVVEATLYETITVPVGLFHPSTGALQIRTIDVIILLALVANLAADRGARRVYSLTSLLWLAFGVWLVGEAFVGVLNGNSTTYIGYELKTIIYLGLFSIASRVKLRDPLTLRS